MTVFINYIVRIYMYNTNVHVQYCCKNMFLLHVCFDKSFQECNVIGTWYCVPSFSTIFETECPRILFVFPTVFMNITVRIIQIYKTDFVLYCCKINICFAFVIINSSSREF